MYKKQTSVSHSSTESENISLDAGLRIDGLLALDIWDIVIEVLQSTKDSTQPKHTGHQQTGAVLDSETQTQHVKKKQKVDQLSDVDHVPFNTQSSQGEFQLYIFEDNEVVIKMLIKGRDPTMRHLSRTHRAALDWLFDRINMDPKIQIRYIDIKHQIEDMLAKGSFSRDEWNHLFRHILAAISKVFSRARERIAIGAMSKRWRVTTSSDGSPVAKPRPTNLVMHSQSKEDVSPQNRDLWSIWWMTTKGKELALHEETGDIPTQTSKFETPKWIDKRRLIQHPGNLGRKTKPEQKVKRIIVAQGNLMHHHQNWRTWDSLIINAWERYSMHTEGIGKNCNTCYVLSGILQHQCIDVVNVHGMVDESRYPSWAWQVMRTPKAQGNLLHLHQGSETWNTRIIDTWVRSFSVWRRGWECVQSAQNSPWTHTWQMYSYGDFFDFVDDSRHPPLA